jgi:cytochrome c biogenesis protein ResB
MLKILETAASIKTASLIALILTAAMIVATLFNQNFADRYFYASPWFIALLALFTANLLLCLILRATKKGRRIRFLFIHAGILIVIAGGVTTALTSEGGYVVLGQGDSASEYYECVRGCGMCAAIGYILSKDEPGEIFECPACGGLGVKKTGEARPLGFKITLEKFEAKMRRDKRTPESFRSDVEISGTEGTKKESILVNHPASEGGFRIYQSGYDPVRNAWTILHVRRDPGTPVVFAGFAVAALGLVVFLLTSPARRREDVG